MIFVTVGAQMPFDRLIRTVDGWANSRARSDVFAQIGLSGYCPKTIAFKHVIDPLEFRARVEAATIIVAHAGMGSIITALEFGKPIIVMPRRESFKETRNDHQVATAAQLVQLDRIAVAFDEHQLYEILDKSDRLRGKDPINPHASPCLISALHEFIDQKPTVRMHDKNA